jgi:hypothetical protein
LQSRRQQAPIDTLEKSLCDIALPRRVNGNSWSQARSGCSQFRWGLIQKSAGHEIRKYRKHDAISLAGLIAKREVSAQEVPEAAIARAEQINPVINAIVHKQYVRARKAVVLAAACNAARSELTAIQRCPCLD